jgi:hypothetical protein
MAKITLSTKRLQISKANATVSLVVAASAFVTIFSLVSIRALVIKRSYQAKVISEKEKAAKQLKDNIKAVDSLVVSYKEFIGRPSNIIGGSTADNVGALSDRDGDNAKITLDALPSKYDFPALTTSLEKLVLQKNFKIRSIEGTDDEITQQKVTDQTSPNPVEIPFKLTVSGNYDPLQDLITTLERSIRPIQAVSLTFNASGGSNEVDVELNAKTFYLPEKSLNITTKDVL